jgi:hypothetical protein
MQVNKCFYAFFLVISLWVGQTSGVAYGQGNSLKEADSLFSIGKFEAATTLYASLIKNEKKYNPNIALKLAYLYEKRDDYAEALYYLGVYGNHNPSLAVLKHQEIIAIQHGLSGYNVSDYEVLVMFVRRYGIYVPILLLGFGLYVFVLLAFRKIKNKPVSQNRKWIFISYLVAIGLLLNGSTGYKEGVVNTDKAMLRGQPSSASDVLGIIPKGERVLILYDFDIWDVVLWKGGIAYLKNNQTWKI